MTQPILITALISALGMGLRLWFWYAAARTIASAKRSRSIDLADGGLTIDTHLSFDQRVARRLEELNADETRPPASHAVRQAPKFGQRPF